MVCSSLIISRKAAQARSSLISRRYPKRIPEIHFAMLLLWQPPPFAPPLSGVNKLQHMTAAFDNCKWSMGMQVLGMSFVVSSPAAGTHLICRENKTLWDGRYNEMSVTPEGKPSHGKYWFGRGLDKVMIRAYQIVKALRNVCTSYISPEVESDPLLSAKFRGKVFSQKKQKPPL